MTYYEDADTLRDVIQHLEAENAALKAQRDAWKTEAEYQYGLLRVSKYGSDPDYPTEGALDAYARGKYPALRKRINE